MMFKRMFAEGSLVFRRGFTLAEIMVAIAVLGILSAMLIPQVMKNTPNTSKVMFKKAYYNLSKAINDMINDEEIYPSDQVNASLNNMYRGFNYTYGNSTTNYYSAPKFCYLLADRMNVTASSFPTNTGGTGTGVCTFTTADGMSWSVYIPKSDASSQADNDGDANTYNQVQFPLCSGVTTNKCGSTFYTTMVVVDVNGSKSPGCSKPAISIPTASPVISVSACTGTTFPDTFQMGIRFDGKINVTDASAVDILADPTNNTK